jgi:hypothetical protein
MCNVRATARRLRGPAPLTPVRRSSNLWLAGFNVETHPLRRTTRLRSCRWEMAVCLRARVELWCAWCAGVLTAAEAPTAGAGAVDAGGVWAGGVVDGVGDDGDGVTGAGGVADGTLAGGGLVAGAVAVGAGGVDPGTVTVTDETPGVVVVAAPLRSGCTANATSAIVSSMPRTIRRRANGCVACTAATTCCSLGVPSRIQKFMTNPFHRAYVRRRRRAPTWTLV